LQKIAQASRIDVRRLVSEPDDDVHVGLSKPPLRHTEMTRDRVAVNPAHLEAAALDAAEVVFAQAVGGETFSKLRLREATQDAGGFDTTLEFFGVEHKRVLTASFP
jgi:hypothetical protein